MQRTKKVYDIRIKTDSIKLLEYLIYFHSKEVLPMIGMDTKTYFKFPYCMRKAFLSRWYHKKLTNTEIKQFVKDFIFNETSSILLNYAIHHGWISSDAIRLSLADLTFPEFQKVFVRDRATYSWLCHSLLHQCPKEYLPGILTTITKKWETTSEPGKSYVHAIETRLKEAHS